MPPLGLVRFSEGAGQHALAHSLVRLVYLLVRFLRADGRQLVVQLFLVLTGIFYFVYIFKLRNFFIAMTLPLLDKKHYFVNY